MLLCAHQPATNFNHVSYFFAFVVKLDVFRVIRGSCYNLLILMCMYLYSFLFFVCFLKAWCKALVFDNMSIKSKKVCEGVTLNGRVQRRILLFMSLAKPS